MDFDQLAEELAAELAVVSARAQRGIVAAMSGGQGAGKSTLAGKLVHALERQQISAFACSLDDFYLTRAERLDLGLKVHPLLATRGVPGTHDVVLMEHTLETLQRGKPADVPVFDKARDDRLPRAAWRRVEDAPRIVIVEGWCLGARPQPAAALAEPVNGLESSEDPSGTWRWYVNEALGQRYARLWTRFDHLLFLAVPGLDAVVQWRGRQEASLPAARRMSGPALRRFIDHYERLTRWMLEDMPGIADLTATLRADHSVETLLDRSGGTFMSRSAAPP